MAISAGLVKELRDRTAAGMMDCKKALTETDGDIERAVELLRQIGAASAERKAGRIAAEGVIDQLVDEEGRRGVVVEVNCETDFVAKDESFRQFVRAVAQSVLEYGPDNLESLSQMTLGDGTIETARQKLIGQVGENVSIRRFERMIEENGLIAGYLHSRVRRGEHAQADGGWLQDRRVGRRPRGAADATSDRRPFPLGHAQGAAGRRIIRAPP